jgi:hypothetical protein
MNHRGPDVRDWQIERHLLGELPRSESEAVARALATEGPAAERAREIEDSNRRILEAHPARIAAAVIRERLAADRPTSGVGEGAHPVRDWRRPALALAASAVVIVAGSLLLSRPEIPVSENRIKGLRPSLLVYRHTPSGDEVLPDRAPARAGDLVQLTYQAAGRRFGAIVSLDGRGAVTVHHPQGGTQAGRLASGKPVRLGSAYRLDDAPGWERFFLVTSDHAFDVDTVVQAARRLGRDPNASVDRLPLPESLDQASLTLTKETQR